MPDLDSLAETTCTKLLNVAHLKAICRARGFSPPGGGKEALARFVAPRLLETTGAARAAATLEPTWTRTLHGIAMAKEPPDLQALLEFAEPESSRWDADFRAFFKRVGNGLLGCGLVLVQDRPSWSARYGSRFEQLAFLLPDVHRKVLPPYPVETRPLGAERHRGEAASFCRSVLQAGCRGETSAKGLRDRVASALVLGEGPIRLGDVAITDLARFVNRSRRMWTAGGKGRRTPGTAGSKNPAPFEAAAHILAHLEPGEGVTEDSLHSALAEIGREKPRKEFGAFLADGVEAGFLCRGGSPKAPLFRMPDPKTARSEAARDTEAALTFSVIDGGIRVKLDSTDLDALFSLAAVSRATPRGHALDLVPHDVLLGRRAGDLPSMASLALVRAASPTFERAASRAETRHGRLLLHEGLLVLRVEDVGLRAVLEQALGSSLRPIQGAYLAVPRGLQAKIEALAQKEGYTPRRVT